MRLVRVLVAERVLDEWLELLEQHPIDYVVTPESSGREDAVIVEFPLPTAAVNDVLSDIREAGLDHEYAVISEAHTAQTTRFRDLQEEYAGVVDDSIDPLEIRSAAFEMSPSPLTYYVMTILSAVVATAGLLLDSAAIVIGAMVIAPQLGAAITASIGTILNDRAMIVDGFRSFVGGLLVAMIGAVVFSWFIRTMHFLPPALDVETVAQIDSRTSPGILSVVIGICAGAAGAFGLATAVPLSIVGVMVAAAVIPPAAAVGIALVWSLPDVAMGAFVLLVINAVFITLTMMFVLAALGYRPETWSTGTFREHISFKTANYAVVSVGVLVVLLFGSGLLIADEVRFDREVNSEVESVLNEDEYNDLELVEIETEFTSGDVTDDEREISVIINRPADEEYPGLADRLADRVTERTDIDTHIEIEYREKEWSEGS